MLRRYRQPETINLTSVQVYVAWHSRTNGPTTWGFFDVQQTGDAQPIGVNTIGYATGSAAKILGLSEGSPGYPGVPYSEAFASSPGNTVKSIGAWLDRFRASVDSSWTSCEIDYPPTAFQTHWLMKFRIGRSSTLQFNVPQAGSLPRLARHRCSVALTTIPPARANEASKPAIRVCRHRLASPQTIFGRDQHAFSERGEWYQSSPMANPRNGVRCRASA